MLTHEFVALSRNEVLQSIEESVKKGGDEYVPYSILDERKCVCVDDNIILDNYKEFICGYGNFKTYWGNYKNCDYGLDYYGITIILCEDLPDFINILFKYETSQCIKELIEMCNSAIKQKMDIVHFGI